MIWWHQVGQKVICVKGPLRPSYLDEIQPVVGETYTIREIVVGFGGDICFRLNEIINEFYLYSDYSEPYECRFFASRFRPVKNTSIDSFRSLLSPTPEDIEKFSKELEEA